MTAAPTSRRGHLGSLILSVVGIILTMLLLLSAPASAQEFRGTISGTVTDSTGAVIKDAQVTITETSTNTVNRTKIGQRGPVCRSLSAARYYQISSR